MEPGVAQFRGEFGPQCLPRIFCSSLQDSYLAVSAESKEKIYPNRKEETKLNRIQYKNEKKTQVLHILDNPFVRLDENQREKSL